MKNSSNEEKIGECIFNVLIKIMSFTKDEIGKLEKNDDIKELVFYNVIVYIVPAFIDSLAKGNGLNPDHKYIVNFKEKIFEEIKERLIDSCDAKSLLINGEIMRAN